MHNMGTRLPNQQHLSRRHTPILSKGQVVQWEYFMLFRVKVNSFEKFNLTLKYIIFLTVATVHIWPDVIF